MPGKLPWVGGRRKLPTGRVLLRHRTDPPVSLPRPLLVKTAWPCGKGEEGCLCHSRAMVAEFGAEREPLKDWRRR